MDGMGVKIVLRVMDPPSAVHGHGGALGQELQAVTEPLTVVENTWVRCNCYCPQKL